MTQIRTENKNYYAEIICAKEANQLIKKYHYSGKFVTNSKLHLGIFSKSNNNKLVGALSFGPPMNPKKTPQKIVQSSDGTDMFELNRMAMSDEEPKFSESQAIGLALKYIRRFQPQIKWLLSFSDGKQGNVGIIYQATGWTYLGYNLSASFWDCDGNILHNIQIWHQYKEGKPLVNTTDALCDSFNNVKKIEARQHIYVYPLSSNLTFLREQKPYPKKETEPKIVSQTYYKINGVRVSTPTKELLI